jgi:Family of unknown function (DUF5946)
MDGSQALEVSTPSSFERQLRRGQEASGLMLGPSNGEVVGPAKWTLAGQRVEASHPSACPGCGLVLAPFNGPTHAYIGASPACWRLYGQVSTISWGPRDGLPLRRLVADTYHVQHPGVRRVRAVQSVAVHLMGLCMILDRGIEPVQIRRLGGERSPVRRTVDLHWLEPPRPNGTLTVRAPLDAVGAEQHAASVEAWARDVWSAWEPHHDTVRSWLDRTLPR